jgi:hypothetical protein
LTNIIVALPELGDAKGIKNVLVRNGFRVTGVCTAGAQVIGQADGLNDGIVICSYKLTDMVYSTLRECLPPGFELLLIASDHLLSHCGGEGIVRLSMPLKVNDLVSTVGMMTAEQERRRRRARLKPKVRSAEEEKVLREAKEVLMVRNHLTEEEAHRYLQKCSMDSGTNLTETALMVLSMMKG